MIQYAQPSADAAPNQGFIGFGLFGWQSAAAPLVVLSRSPIVLVRASLRSVNPARLRSKTGAQLRRESPWA